MRIRIRLRGGCCSAAVLRRKDLFPPSSYDETEWICYLDVFVLGVGLSNERFQLLSEMAICSVKFLELSAGASRAGKT